MARQASVHDHRIASASDRRLPLGLRDEWPPDVFAASWRTLTRAGHMKRGCDWCGARFANGDRVTTLSKSVDLRFHFPCAMEYLSKWAVRTGRASAWPRTDARPAPPQPEALRPDPDRSR